MWKDILEHLYRDRFLTAAKKKYRDLKHCDIFHYISRAITNFKILLLIWRYIYKFNEDDYLTKFKARIYIRGDLQDSNKFNTYTATLAARTLRALLTIIAAFNLKAVQ